MSDNLPLPELVIGIDFGMTCIILFFIPICARLLTICIGTGVAFCNVATGEETIRWLQRWPGRANAVENKVCNCNVDVAILIETGISIQ